MNNKPLKIFISAGEPSGDFLGARLMAALKKKTKNELTFIGVGGEQMEKEGLCSAFPMKELSLMGFVEVLPHIFHLRQRLLGLVSYIASEKPDVVITIDSPGFHLPLAKKIRALCVKKGFSIPSIHYVAPTVWAWKSKRAAKMAKFYDHVLTVLPFEPPYFQREGLDATFVGHPLTELSVADASGEVFRARHKLSEKDTLLCLLPGSRVGELTRHLPVFSELIGDLIQKYPTLKIVIPTLAEHKAQVQEATASWTVPVIIVTEREEKYQAFKAARAAVAVSGTITLELALAGLPMVVTYRVNRLTAWLARRLIKIPYVSLVNILLKRRSVPEMLQDNCQPKKIAEVVSYLLEDTPVRQAQLKDLKEVAHLITCGKTGASAMAADVILKLIEK